MQRAGFTLLELLIVLLIASILLTVGIPALNRFGLDARRTADINAFVASVHLARNESAKRNRAVTLCQSSDGRSCAGREAGFDTGWLVYIDDPAAPLLSYRTVMTGRIRSNRQSYTFHPNFRRGTNGTVTFCDQRGSVGARAIVISYTGRPRVTSADSRGEPLACPA